MDKLKQELQKFYLDYFNNYLTVEKIAEHYEISTELAGLIIKEMEQQQEENNKLNKQKGL